MKGFCPWRMLNEIDEPFLHNSLMLVVDSVDSEKVRKAMETELEQLMNAMPWTGASMKRRPALRLPLV